MIVIKPVFISVRPDAATLGRLDCCSVGEETVETVERMFADASDTSLKRGVNEIFDLRR